VRIQKTGREVAAAELDAPFSGALCVLARKRISGAVSLLSRVRQLF
jgi:hypothetical protein